MFAHRPRGRGGIAIGNVDQESVRQHSPTAQQIKTAVGDGFSVGLKIKHTPLIGSERSKPRIQQLLVIVVPLLKMMRAEEHSLVPHNFAITAHTFVGVSLRSNRRLDYKTAATGSVRID